MTTHQHRTTIYDLGDSSVTLLVCSDCGAGHYHRDAHSRSVNCTNPECRRNIIVSLDVERYLDEGERIDWTDSDLLAVTR
jgi:hypothetical protein